MLSKQPVLSVSRSNSLSFIPCVDPHVRNDRSRSTCKNMALLTMGPVATAVVLFVVEKAVSRAVKGQLMRKGVLRKMRRLSRMVLEWNVVLSILYDMMEDILQ